MATKTYQQITGPAENTVNSYFKPGDTCYHTHSGVTVPAIIVGLVVLNTPQVSGDNVLYDVIGDATVSYSGVARGPFRLVPAANLATR